MSQIKISSEPNKKICDAVGCSSGATEKIFVKVGTRGRIALQLCKNCTAKF